MHHDIYGKQISCDFPGCDKKDFAIVDIDIDPGNEDFAPKLEVYVEQLPIGWIEFDHVYNYRPKYGSASKMTLKRHFCPEHSNEDKKVLDG